MLTQFRENGLLKGLMGVVVVLIIAAFAFTGGGPMQSAEPSLCAVEVEGKCVEVGDYNALVRLIAPPGASNKQLAKMGFTKFAIEALVERELLLKEARRLGVAISDDDVDDELAAGRVHFSWPVDAPIPRALAAGQPFPKLGANEAVVQLNFSDPSSGAFDFKKYQRQVQRLTRMSNKDFKRSQREELVAARVRRMVAAPVTVSEAEVFAEFERQKSSATTRTVEADAAWFSRFGEAISDTVATDYLDKHKEAIDKAYEVAKANWQAGCILASEVFFKYPAGASEEDKGAAKTQLAEASAELTSGGPFGSVARLHSDAESALVDGFIGCVVKGNTPAHEAGIEALGKLSQGQWATVDAPDGLRLLRHEGTLADDQVEARARLEIARRLAAVDAGRERAKAFATELIAAGKAGQELKAATEALRQRYALITMPAGLQKAALETAASHKLAPSMEISRTFTRASSPIFGVKDSVNVAELVFALAKPDDMVEQAIETHSGFAVLQLKEKSLATQAQFEEKKADLMMELQQFKRADALARYVERLRKNVKDVRVSPEFDGNQAALDGDEENSG